MAERILAVGDLHLRKTAPAMRTDDFFAAQEAKLNEIFAIAEEEECGYVVFPGDVFDRADAPYSLVEWAIRQFQAHDLHYLFIYGQHDLRYHTRDKQNTPLGVLVAGLQDQAVILSPNMPFQFGRFVFWGCSWGEYHLLPTWGLLVGNAVNVVVLHKSVTVEPLPYDDVVSAKALVQACPAQLFIAGDNHVQFTADFKQASVLNMGSVMRTSIAQIDHKPVVAVVTATADEVKYSVQHLTIQKHVFDEQVAEEAKESDERMTAFVESLSGEFDPELRFLDNLRYAAQTAPEGVQKILQEAMR